MATTARRAGQGDSKVFKLADGRWCAFIELETGPNGKRRRKKIAGVDRDDVIQRRNRLRRDLDEGRVPSDDRMTVAQLVELWLKHRKGRVAPTTLSNYRSVAHRHITGRPRSEHLPEIPTPPIGRKQLSRLKALEVSNLLLEKQDTLSPRSVKMIRTILGAAFEWGVGQGVVQRNVVKFTEGPRQRQTTQRAMTEKQARAVLEAAKGNRFEAAFALMLALGLRPGECLGLRWSDMDLKNRTLTVRRGLKRDGSLGDVKNNGSRRQLTIPESLVPLLEARAEIQDLDRRFAEEYWQGDTDDLVFTTEYGTPVSDRNLANRDFKSICEKAEVGKWHLHECRHTAATLMLTNGLPIEVVSKVLGHADIRMTANVYAHLLPRHLTPAAEAMGTVLWGAST